MVGHDEYTAPRRLKFLPQEWGESAFFNLLLPVIKEGLVDRVVAGEIGGQVLQESSGDTDSSDSLPPLTSLQSLNMTVRDYFATGIPGLVHLNSRINPFFQLGTDAAASEEEREV